MPQHMAEPRGQRSLGAAPMHTWSRFCSRGPTGKCLVLLPGRRGRGQAATDRATGRSCRGSPGSRPTAVLRNLGEESGLCWVWNEGAGQWGSSGRSLLTQGSPAPTSTIKRNVKIMESPCDRELIDNHKTFILHHKNFLEFPFQIFTLFPFSCYFIYYFLLW